jgi:hypothetical protein
LAHSSFEVVYTDVFGVVTRHDQISGELLPVEWTNTGAWC